MSLGTDANGCIHLSKIHQIVPLTFVHYIESKFYYPPSYGILIVACHRGMS